MELKSLRYDLILSFVEVDWTNCHIYFKSDQVKLKCCVKRSTANSQNLMKEIIFQTKTWRSFTKLDEIVFYIIYAQIFAIGTFLQPEMYVSVMTLGNCHILLFEDVFPK